MNRVTLSVVYKGLAVLVICIGVLATLLRNSGLVPAGVTSNRILVVMLVLLLGMVVAYVLDTYSTRYN